MTPSLFIEILELIQDYLKNPVREYDSRRFAVRPGMAAGAGPCRSGTGNDPSSRRRSRIPRPPRPAQRLRRGRHLDPAGQRAADHQGADTGHPEKRGPKQQTPEAAPEGAERAPVLHPVPGVVVADDVFLRMAIPAHDGQLLHVEAGLLQHLKVAAVVKAALGHPQSVRRNALSELGHPSEVEGEGREIAGVDADDLGPGGHRRRWVLVREDLDKGLQPELEGRR